MDSKNGETDDPQQGGGRDERAATHADAPNRGPTDSGLLARLKGIWANPSYRFVLLFIPYLMVISVGYPLLLTHWGGFVQAFIDATASIEYYMFRPFTEHIAVDGKMVMFRSFGVRIVDECTGIYEMLIFSAAVAAFPTSVKHKILGFLFGNPLIYLFNVLRIAVLIAVGHYHRESCGFGDVYLMQATMIVMITSVWLLWITVVVRDRSDAPATPAA
jgi:archaeosortase B (VPXXXP-CTERM-specific)